MDEKEFINIKKKNPKEKTIIGNWLKMPFQKNSFDIVMSDHPTSSIRYQYANKLFSEIQRVLNPKGHIIIDLHINAQEKPLTLGEYINLYRKNPNSFKNFDNLVYAQYRVIMGYNNFYNPKTFRSQWGKFDKLLRKKYEQGIITKKEFKEMAPGLGEEYIFNFYTKKAAEKIIKKYFKILNFQHIQDHPVYKYYWPCFAKSLKKN